MQPACVEQVRPDVYMQPKWVVPTLIRLSTPFRRACRVCVILLVHVAACTDPAKEDTSDDYVEAS